MSQWSTQSAPRSRFASNNQWLSAPVRLPKNLISNTLFRIEYLFPWKGMIWDKVDWYFIAKFTACLAKVTYGSRSLKFSVMSSRVWWWKARDVLTRHLVGFIWTYSCVRTRSSSPAASSLSRDTYSRPTHLTRGSLQSLCLFLKNSYFLSALNRSVHHHRVHSAENTFDVSILNTTRLQDRVPLHCF